MWPFVAAWFREMTVRVSFVGGLALAKKTFAFCTAGNLGNISSCSTPHSA